MAGIVIAIGVYEAAVLATAATASVCAASPGCRKAVQDASTGIATGIDGATQAAKRNLAAARDWVKSTCRTGPNPRCPDLESKIDELVNRDKRAAGGGGTHGLKHRYQEQLMGGCPPGTASWRNHVNAYKNQQRGLADRIMEAIDLGCNPSDEALEWVSKPHPKTSDYVGPPKANWKLEC